MQTIRQSPKTNTDDFIRFRFSLQLQQCQQIDEESIAKLQQNSPSRKPLSMDFDSGNDGINSSLIKPQFTRQISRRHKSINFSRHLSSTVN